MKKFFFIIVLMVTSQAAYSGKLSTTASAGISHSSGTEQNATADSEINNTTISAHYNLGYDLKNTQFNLGYQISYKIDDVNDTTSNDDQLNLNFNTRLSLTESWLTIISSSIEERSINTTGRLLGTDDEKKHFIQHAVNSQYDNSLSQYLNYSISANLQSSGFESENKTDTIAIATSLSSAVSNSSLSWSAHFQSSTSNSFDDHIDTTSLNVGYQINNHFQTFFNTQIFETTETNLESRRDTAGLLWTISGRSSVRLDLGQFEDSDTWSLNVNLRSKRTNYQLSHTETITNSSLALNQIPTDLSVDNFSDSNLVDVTFLEKRDTISLQHQMRRLSSQFNYFQSARFTDFSNSSFQELEGFAANFNYQLSRNSSLNFSSSSSIDNQTIKTTQTASSLSWVKTRLKNQFLGKNASVALSYTESETKSTETNRINSVTVNWSGNPNKNSTFSIQYKISDQTSDVIDNNYKQDEVNLTYLYAF